ncbi:chorismate mutase (chromatophore) [Paulinella micropora]|uniref:Chorismate mutase n=1 Tax=Paulinella micropora TaxID=1928728 RepID=A0A1L5YCQ1_9EUKA|nr:chorismate mutase [Paulinella micropora]AQX45247.1 chorismate mutase [Paulinella micropora]BBL86465.1 chorismate mutase [Paulinella micropora]
MRNHRELRALRGATTAGANTSAAITESVEELLLALIENNNFKGEHVVSVTFSVTGDLNACFPAAVARRWTGWDTVALLDCQQMAVIGDLPRCIRLMAHVWLEPGQEIFHPYLRGAARLRPDRSNYIRKSQEGTRPSDKNKD